MSLIAKAMVDHDEQDPHVIGLTREIAAVRKHLDRMAPPGAERG